jgi:GH15 family glucan-1,4-alpha-glucosidase
MPQAPSSCGQTPGVADPYPPISDYALLSDCHSGALVSKDGSIDWCAFHRFEARPVFARLLDWNKGGYFRIAPTGDYEASRQYVPNTNVLETRFETSAGAFTLTDALVVRVEEGHPDHRLVRRLRCESGQIDVRMRFEPRFDYALTEPRVELVDDDLAIATEARTRSCCRRSSRSARLRSRPARPSTRWPKATTCS